MFKNSPGTSCPKMSNSSSWTLCKMLCKWKYKSILSCTVFKNMFWLKNCVLPRACHLPRKPCVDVTASFHLMHSSLAFPTLPHENAACLECYLALTVLFKSHLFCVSFFNYHIHKTQFLCQNTLILMLLLSLLFFEMGSHYVAWASLELAI